MAKGRTRKATRKQALSYRRMTPNGRGVTAIAEVNGRGSFLKRQAKTLKASTLRKAAKSALVPKGQRKIARKELRRRGLKPNAKLAAVRRADLRSRRRGSLDPRDPGGPRATVKSRVASRKSWERTRTKFLATKDATPNKRKGPPALVKKVMRACGVAMKAAWKTVKAKKRGGKKPAKRSYRRNARGSYAKNYAATKAVLRKNRGRRIEGLPVFEIDDATTAYVAKAKAPKERTMKRKSKAKGGKRRVTAKQRAAARRNIKKAQAALRRKARSSGRRKSARKGTKRSGKSTRRKARRTSSARSAVPRRISVRLGKRTVRTYLTSGKGGRAKHIPRYRTLGYRSEKALQKALQAGGKTSERLSKRMGAIFRARKRASERVLKHGDVFTPNTSVISYGEWSKNMKRNGKKKRSGGKRKTTAKQRAAARRNIKKAQAASRRRKSSGRKKTTTTKRRKARKGGKRRTTAKQRAAARRNIKKAQAASRRRKSGGKRRRSTSSRRKGAARRRTSGSSRRRGRVTKSAARRAVKTLSKFTKNGRFRKNAFLALLKETLKAGSIIVGGFLVHRVLTRVLDDQANKAGLMTTGEAATYRGIVIGVLVAVAEVAGAYKLLKDSKKAASVAGGAAASLLHAVVVLLLNKMNQPKVAGYFASYPDASGRAYGEYIATQGYGAYEMQPMQGFGSPVMQAAAGFGQPIMQAAAGFGELTQAAAGMGSMGEFYVSGVNGYGEYEMTQGPTGVAPLGRIVDGIRPEAAERALTISEAAAGVGDLPMQSILDPEMVALPVQDVPDGMRSGILQGGDGIFG